MERTSRWHRADRKAEIEEADGSSSREGGSVSLTEVNNSEVAKDLSNVATLFWAEGVWMGRWRREQQKAWRTQIFKVQTWRQVGGPAGAVTRETRDLGLKSPQWHTFVFEEQAAVCMRVVCPREMKICF